MFELITQEEFESISEKAMLNDELKAILEMKIKGYSITQISMKLNISERTTYRRIKQFKWNIKSRNILFIIKCIFKGTEKINRKDMEEI